MTSEQIALAQSSFAQVIPIADTAAALFYGRLFELAPELRPLFKGELQEQGRKLMRMIGLAVKSLDQWETLAPVLRDLGQRHEQYGVREQDYDTVGAAMLWTLEQGLGPSFTPEVKAAWVAVYARITGVMQRATARTQRLDHAA